MNLLTFVVTRSCPLINPRPRQITRIIYLSAYTSIYRRRIDAMLRLNAARKAEPNPSRKGDARADVTARNLTRRVPTSAIRLVEPTQRKRGQRRERAGEDGHCGMHARTHARTRRATYSNVRGNAVQPACRLSARRSLVFSMLATR